MEPPLALALYADGVRDVRLFVGGDGVVKKGRTNEDNGIEALKEQEVKEYLKEFFCDAQDQWDEVSKFLTTNVASFPLFEVKEQVVRDLNDNDRGFFVGM